jgi:hypothetical protein
VNVHKTWRLAGRGWKGFYPIDVLQRGSTALSEHEVAWYPQNCPPPWMEDEKCFKEILVHLQGQQSKQLNTASSTVN